MRFLRLLRKITYMEEKNIKKTSSVGRFIEEYTASAPVRLHMPGHKGAFGYAGDITEIKGADSLYAANGVIAEAETEASHLFGSRRTFFGTEGSSQMIKAMCLLALKNYRKKVVTEEHPVILATRNAHRSFIYASMLLGFRIHWLSRENTDFSLCRCEFDANDLNSLLEKYPDKSELAAVYVTSPDYLGNLLDIKGLSKVAHSHGLMLLCDNAHGAYLRFMENDMHPLSLGADMTTDSAHKTLPVLTGGAYLHISEKAPKGLESDAKNALLAFGSTSPSYLILESLAEASKRITKEAYTDTAAKISALRKSLTSLGYVLYGDEPLKLVIDMRQSALSGEAFAEKLRKYNIECEYADPDFLVTMWSTYNNYPKDTDLFITALKELLPEYQKNAAAKAALITALPRAVYQPCEIMYHEHTTVSVEDPSLIGRIAADTLISCPPAVSPVVAGEMIDENVINVLRYYGFETIEVLLPV